MNPNTPRQPIFNVPVVLLTVLAVLLAIHLVRQFLSPEIDDRVLSMFAFVPGRFTFAIDPARVVGQFRGVDAGNPDIMGRIEAARFFLGNGRLQPWTVITYALLHGSWVHVGLNSIWLLAFGAPVARRFGPWRFIIFLVAGAVAGALTHVALFPLSLEPLIGASAAVSACMGAALRFIFQPEQQATLVAREGRSTVDSSPAVPLRLVLRDRRAVVFLIAWFGTNLVTGLGAFSAQMSDAPIAWQAHIGGFLLGLLAFRLFDPRREELPLTAPPLAPDSPEDVV